MNADKELQLRRMKRIPLLLLLIMAVLFACTLHHPALSGSLETVFAAAFTGLFWIPDTAVHGDPGTGR